MNQIYDKWELIIIDDGSTDNTDEFIVDYFSDNRITYIKNKHNQGLGVALNEGIEMAKYDYIAYLPADDYYYENHLAEIYEKFIACEDVFLVYTGVAYNRNDTFSKENDTQTKFLRKKYPLQLVQIAHKKSSERWLERKEYVTSNLFSMYWYKLLDKGFFVSTGIISCYWTSHPYQRHKIINDKSGSGGLNIYKNYYKVKEFVRIQISDYKFVDENKIYENLNLQTVYSKKSLKILLVGELSYNPERIFALEEAGHKLYGLWIDDPIYSFANIGPFPFGNIETIEHDNNWMNKIQDIKPDIIYALGNWDSIELAHEVLIADLKIPFVWHFKEGPLFCIKRGLWKKLYELYYYSDGKIFINEIIKNWYEQFSPTFEKYLILDLDPPKKNYFNSNFEEKISAKDGAIHTVNVGRIIGLDENDIKAIADHNIHIHLYSENTHEMKENINNIYMKYAPDHFHVHNHVSINDWTKEFSKYDAGWLHIFKSENEKSLSKMSWDDLNIPARIYTLAVAGIPMIQWDNSNHLVAMHDFVKKLNVGVFYTDVNELKNELYDKNKMAILAQNIIREREKFTFDYHVPRLINFFYEIIKAKK